MVGSAERAARDDFRGPLPFPADSEIHAPVAPASPRYAGRRVTALLSASQSSPGVDCALFLLDEELMAAVADGSAGALAELYDRYATRAYRVAWTICRERGRAEEAVQEAFLAIWRAPSSYERRRGPVSAWLLTVVRYRAIDAARRDGFQSERRATEDMLAARPAPVDVLAEALARADRDDLQVALQRLPAAQRQVIHLGFYGQLSHTEIAARLNLRPGTVKGRMRLGLKKLRADLQRTSD